MRWAAATEVRRCQEAGMMAFRGVPLRTSAARLGMDERMLPIAKEGLRELTLGTIALGALGIGSAYVYWPLVVVPTLLWIWLIAFFRDPRRVRNYAPSDLCSPADGTITEIAELDDYESIVGPALRIGMFLSLFNVHVNRAPCGGTVRRVTYRKGEFLDARHPESGTRNESNTLMIEPDGPMPGPIYVRQVAGLVARRIICHAKTGDHMPIGYRFGLIKFGSRTELIIPHREDTEILVKLGDEVRGGLTILARQPGVERTAPAPDGISATSAVAT